MKKQVALMFGGPSAEHEVSVITGLQVAEKIDRNRYDTHVIYWAKDGLFYYYPNLKSRRDWKMIKPIPVGFVRNPGGVFLMKLTGLFKAQIPLEVALLAFHGGLGESGAVQGMLESLGLPISSPNFESSSIVMNKALTKTVLSAARIKVVDGTNVLESEFKSNPEELAQQIYSKFGTVILKPAHLGSSIGISIARSAIELEKQLNQAFFIDSEVVVEKLLSNFTEYNCAVREVNGQVEVSEIEKPIKHDEILSFADKYQRGGGKKTGGMASLVRELPAQISNERKTEIQAVAKRAFIACRCSGMVRVDFMVDGSGELFLTEINPIPGSLSYYLWEASGVSFRQLITDLIENARIANQKSLQYESDIIDRFIAS